MTNPILSVQHLTASYHRHEVLHDVSLMIHEGEFVAITGPSGIGKSTFLEAILGNLRQRMWLKKDVEIRLDGAEWAHLTMKERQVVYREKIGVIFQNVAASFDRAYTIGEQLEEVMPGATSETMAALLADVHLEAAVLSCYPQQLSGGMLQRVAFAFAICHQPRLIIADEPLSALDAALQEEMMQLLANYVQRHQACAIMVTHQQQLAHTYATHVYTLQDGQLSRQQEQDTTERPSTTMTHATGPALFSLTNVCKSYNTLPVLTDVTLTIPQGSFTGIIGESGIGKTTLGKILAGLTNYDSGTVQYDGEELAAHLERVGQAYYKDVQVIYQNSVLAFNPRQTIRRSLEEPLRFHQGIKDRTKRHALIEAAFHQFDLDLEWLEKYPQQLSGGQCQRCAIVRALLAQPRVLICDEVTSALDEDNQRLVMRELAKLHEAGMTVVMISHQVELIRPYCQQLVVLS